MAEDRAYEPPAIRRFMATRWGTAARMLFSIGLTAAGVSTAVGAHNRGSLVGTGFGVALTLSGLLSAARHAGVLSGRTAPRPPGPRMVTVAAFPTRDEAETAARTLRSVGVRSVVSGDSITVRSSDAERARAFLGTPATQHRGQSSNTSPTSSESAAAAPRTERMAVV